MAEGNGIDLGSIDGLLVEVARKVSRHDTALPSPPRQSGPPVHISG